MVLETVRMTCILAADPQDGFLQSIFGPPSSGVDLGFEKTCELLGLAAGLGLAVAAFYLFSTRRRIRTPGLPGTLVLLAMLIALVTLTIEDNAAKAFTLVGTLAIVRFRTPVHDIRDTAFVIFSVAVGLGVGAFNPVVAAAGTLTVGAMSMFLALIPQGIEGGSGVPFKDEGRLTVRIDKTRTRPAAAIEKTILAHGRAHRLLATRHGRDGAIRLVYAIDIDRDRATDLVTALHDLPGVQRSGITFGLPDDDDP
jgi:hypothetical protein